MSKMIWNGDQLIEWEMDMNSPVYQNMRKWFGELIAKEIEALDDKNESYVWLSGYDWGIKQAANIARGQK